MNKYLEMERTRDQQKLSWQGMFYSIQRIDLLIISICGAGIYLCLETIKFCYENEICISQMLKGSGVLYLIGIVVNFGSQIMSYRSNKEDFLMCEAQLDYGEDPTEEENEEIMQYDKNAETYSEWTMGLNYTSIIFMIFGLIFTLTFFVSTF